MMLGAFLLLPTLAWGQVKAPSYKVLPSGDTINRIDAQQRRHGLWMITGVDDMEQVIVSTGQYTNGKANGVWIKTNRDGLPVAQENYKNDLLDGEASYYDEGRLICVGHYLALRSNYEYDTVWVENPETNLLRAVRIKSNRGSVRHGYWTYYHPGTKQLARVQEYQADSLIYSKEYREPADSVQILKKMKAWPHADNRPLPNVWSMDPQRKPVRFTDFPEDGKGVTPNVKRK
jgi:hypothetical protein